MAEEENTDAEIDEVSENLKVLENIDVVLTVEVGRDRKSVV